MQSDRKKFGEFNQIPTSGIKNGYDNKFKSDRKYQEK
jgi:hypothetical protein